MPGSGEYVPSTAAPRRSKEWSNAAPLPEPGQAGSGPNVTGTFDVLNPQPHKEIPEFVVPLESGGGDEIPPIVDRKPHQLNEFWGRELRRQKSPEERKCAGEEVVEENRGGVTPERAIFEGASWPRQSAGTVNREGSGPTIDVDFEPEVESEAEADGGIDPDHSSRETPETAQAATVIGTGDEAEPGDGSRDEGNETRDGIERVPAESMAGQSSMPGPESPIRQSPAPAPIAKPAREATRLEKALAASEPATVEGQLDDLGYPTRAPATGDGVHVWIWDVALRTKRFPRDEVAAFIFEAVQECGRVIPARELEDALQNARRERSELAGLRDSGQRQPKWPKADRELIDSVLAGGGDLNGLITASDPIPAPRELLLELYRADELICVGTAKNRHFTETVQKVADRNRFDRLPYIVPSPMSKREGRTLNGLNSQRCLDNTGPRRILVIESDKAYLSRDDQAAIIQHLEKRLHRLILVIDSGGKSLHAWFGCRGIPECELRTFMAEAIRLGADHASWTKCQFVRMPGGTREDGAEQRILFFNKRKAHRYV